MGKISDILRLTRIEHSIMLVIAVVAAELLAKGLPQLNVFVLSLIAPIFISAGAFAINDYFDVEVDRANRKNRPLVTGNMSLSGALAITALCMVIGVGASAFLGWYEFAIALAFAILSLLYSYRLKDVLLVGNMYIALSMAIPFIFGDYAVSRSLAGNVVLISIMIFLSGVAREIHGSVRDYQGDRLRNANTFPNVIGVKSSAVTAAVVYLFAILLSLYLFLQTAPFRYNLYFGIPIAVSDIMLIYSALVFLYASKGKYQLARNASLAAMALALVAIFLSAMLTLHI